MKRFLQILLVFCIVFGIVISAVPALAAPGLMSGDKGDEVVALQKVLSSKGYYKGEINGLFGKQLEEAVSSFQKDNSIDVNGQADQATLKALKLYSGSDTQKEAVIEITGEKLNMRTEASSKADVLTELASGTKVQILSLKGSWYLVRLQTGIEGYVSKKYITDDKVSTDTKVYSGSMPISTLSEGVKGQDVVLLQNRLKTLKYFSGKATGNFLTLTAKAVKDFKKANGLKADSVVDIDTILLLFSDNALPKKASAPTVATPVIKDEKPPAVSAEGSQIAIDLANYALTFLGKPYVLGANGPKAYDCSSFTQTVFKKFGYTLPRSAYNQGYNNPGIKITSRGDLKVGDLVCMNTIDDRDLCDHVGIYIGNGQLIHCASGTSRKVIVSNINNKYYTKAFSWGIRIIK